jgi:quinol-cytochrome oxidoreductase complex cytochrome b subunit
LAVFLPKAIGTAYDISNPTEAPTGIHPDWYFMWLYQTLKADAFIPDILLTLFIIAIVVFWFLVPYLDNKFTAGRGGNIINKFALFILFYLFVMTLWGYFNTGISLNEFNTDTNSNMGGIDKFSFSGIIVFTIAVMILLLYARVKSEKKL